MTATPGEGCVAMSSQSGTPTGTGALHSLGSPYLLTPALVLWATLSSKKSLEVSSQPRLRPCGYTQLIDSLNGLIPETHQEKNHHYNLSYLNEPPLSASLSLRKRVILPATWLPCLYLVKAQVQGKAISSTNRSIILHGFS